MSLPVTSEGNVQLAKTFETKSGVLSLGMEPFCFCTDDTSQGMSNRPLQLGKAEMEDPLLRGLLPPRCAAHLQHNYL